MASHSRRRTAESLARRLAAAARRLSQALSESAEPATTRWLQRAQSTVDEQFQRMRHALVAEVELPSWTDAWAQLFIQQQLGRQDGSSGPLFRPAAHERHVGANGDGGSLFVAPPVGSTVERCTAELNGLMSADAVSQALDDLRQRFRTEVPHAYFHESFLAHYASVGRRRQGVFYTPGPLVQYLVRSVDWLLQQCWDLPDGLATSQRPATSSPTSATLSLSAGPDRTLRIVDPACGTGAFLLGVLEHLDKRCGDDAQSWQRLVQHELRQRLRGYELQAVSAVAAQRLFHQNLAQICRRRGSGLPPPLLEEVCPWPVLLGNALEQRSAWPESGTLARELMVILGNPPYANFGRANRFDWILGLLADYKQGLDERKLNLNDDCIKFVRWAQHQVDRAGAGIVAFVTSNTFLTGVTHRQMRRSLLDSFDQIYVLDLHGDAKRDGVGPNGEPDENVFDIQQGVALSLLVKTGGRASRKGVFHGELWGSRASKLDALQSTDVSQTAWRQLPVEPPQAFFVPRSIESAKVYQQFPRLDEIFRQYVSGVQTKRDWLLVDQRPARLAVRMRRWLSDPANRVTRPAAASSAQSHSRRLQRPSGGDFDQLQFDGNSIRPYMVAPLDFRWLYYDPRLVGRPRQQVLRHMRLPNLALVFMRQSTNPGSYDHFLATTELVSDRVFSSAHGAPFLAPLYLHDDQRDRPNLRDDFLRKLSECWQLPFDPLADGQLRTSFGPRDVFHYAYAIFHASEYRRRFDRSLRIDFPRLPLTTDLHLARALCGQGERLVRAHTVCPPLSLDTGLNWRGDDRRPVRLTRPRFEPEPACGTGSSTGFPTGLSTGFPTGLSTASQGRLIVNGQSALHGVRREEWEFRLGGYRVLHRWLSARTGLTLDAAQQQYLIGLVLTLRTTRQAMREIDDLLDPWPWPDAPLAERDGEKR